MGGIGKGLWPTLGGILLFSYLLFRAFSTCVSLSPAETAFNRGVDYTEQGD
jgi:hypothetical protein